MRAPSLSRRGFLQTSGSLVVTFSLGSLFPRGASAQTPAAPAPSGGVPGDTVDGFLAIAADGKVTVFSGKVDLGTGVLTALTQIAQRRTINVCINPMFMRGRPPSSRLPTWAAAAGRGPRAPACRKRSTR